MGSRQHNDIFSMKNKYYFKLTIIDFFFKTAIKLKHGHWKHITISGVL